MAGTAAELQLRPPGGPRMCHKAGGGGGEGAGPRGGGKGSTPGGSLGEGRGEGRKSPGGGGGGGREEVVEGHPASLRKEGTD